MARLLLGTIFMLTLAGKLYAHTSMEPTTPEITEEITESSIPPTTIKMNAAGGVSYIRWGRTRCEGDADVLYIGYAAGKYRSNTAYPRIGTEMICLHNSPQWGNVKTAYRAMSPISGAEYYFEGNDDPFSKVNVGGQSLLQQNMPCSVCHVETRSHQLMIPGRNSCPSGWTQEYRGYLVTSSIDTSGGTYMCLDEAPEAVPGGGASQPYSQFIYGVEVNCGSLLCPPFVQGNEVSCVVCSK